MPWPAKQTLLGTPAHRIDYDLRTPSPLTLPLTVQSKSLHKDIVLSNCYVLHWSFCLGIYRCRLFYENIQPLLVTKNPLRVSQKRCVKICQQGMLLHPYLGMHHPPGLVDRFSMPLSLFQSPYLFIWSYYNLFVLVSFSLYTQKAVQVLFTLPFK